METQVNRNPLLRLWKKIPLILRSVLLGFVISTLGIVSWQVVATIIPMPWSIILMLGLLWVFIKYFSGGGFPVSTKAFRRENFRKTNLSSKTWSIAIVGALLIVLIEQSGLVVTFRLMQFPAENFLTEYSFLQTVPIWMAWLVIIMISMVAGICEEVGFRGYMQGPIEKKYGPLVAIVITSVVFVLVHLHQAWSGPIIIHIFAISALFGALAYYSGSLIPGIIGHIIMDVFNFSFWWSDLGSQFNRVPISTTGIDLHFILWCVILVVGILLFVRSMRRLKIMGKSYN